MTYAFSDGLTLVESTVTNDLVTGTEVAHVEMNTAAGSVFALDDAGAGTLAAAAGLDITAVSNLLLKSTTGNLTVQANAAAKLVHVLGALVTVEADGGNLHLISAGSAYLDTVNTNAFTSGGKTTIQSTGGTADIEMDSGRDFLVNSARQILLLGAGNATLSTGNAGGTLQLTGADAVSLTALGGNLTVTTNGAHDLEVNASRDEAHTVDRNFTVNAGGSSGISLGASHATGKVAIAADDSDIILQAGVGGGTGVVQLQPGTQSATRKLKVFQGVGAGYQTVPAPTGGSVIDVECRAALLGLAQLFANWGFLDMI